MSKKYKVEVILTCEECDNQWGDVIVKEVENVDEESEIGIDGLAEIEIMSDNYGAAIQHEDEDDDQFFCPYCGSSKFLIDEVR